MKHTSRRHGLSSIERVQNMVDWKTKMKIKGKFKSCSLYNNTLHIILYPDDGLRSAAELQKIEEGTEISLTLDLPSKRTLV